MKLRKIDIEHENSPEAYGCNTRAEYDNLCAQVEGQHAGWDGLHDVNIAANERRFLEERKAWEFFGKHHGRNFLVVAAGPNLFAGLEQVHEAHRYGWIIIAVDAAVPHLVNNKLPIDVAIAFDPQPTVSDFYRDLGDSPWFIRISCSPAFAELVPPDRRIWYASSNPFAKTWRTAFKKYGAISCLREFAVVTYTACDLAYKLGAQNIVTIGNDLSYRCPEMCKVCGGIPLAGIWGNLSAGEEIVINQKAGFMTTTNFIRARAGFQELPGIYKDCGFHDLSTGMVLMPKTGWKYIKTLREVE